MVDKHKAEILWQSKELNHNKDPFFSVKRARGYYIYGERTGIDSIAFILFDDNTKKFCLINESKPPMDESQKELVKMTTAFGGSIDSKHFPQEICQTEVLEEAGYEVPLDKIHPTGSTLVSTQMSQMCITYLVDITNIKKTHKAEYELEPDDQQKEKDPNEFKSNSIKWLTFDELFINSDWKSIFITTQAIYKNIIKE